MLFAKVFGVWWKRNGNVIQYLSNNYFFFFRSRKKIIIYWIIIFHFFNYLTNIYGRKKSHTYTEKMEYCQIIPILSLLLAIFIMGNFFFITLNLTFIWLEGAHAKSVCVREREREKWWMSRKKFLQFFFCCGKDITNIFMFSFFSLVP